MYSIQILCITNIFLFASHASDATSEITVIRDTTWYDDFDGWIYSDSNDDTTDTPITTYHGPYVAYSGSEQVYSMMRDFMCNKKSVVHLIYNLSFCQTSNLNYVTLTIQSNSYTETLRWNKGTVLQDSTLRSTCSLWRYQELGPFTIRINTNTAFTVSFEWNVGVSSEEAVALSGINIECNPLPAPSPTAEPTTSTTTTTASSIYAQLYDIIDDIWDDEYELLSASTPGWSTDVDGVEYIDNVIMSSDTDRIYHLFDSDSHQNGVTFILKQSFYCNHAESSVSIRYNVYYCASDANDYVHLFVDDTLMTTTNIAYESEGGDGDSWSDDALDNLCHDPDEWEYQNRIGPYSIEGAVNENELFSVKFELNLSKEQQLIAISGIQIRCEPITSSPTIQPTEIPTYEPTIPPSTSIPTESPTDEPTISPTSSKPTESPTNHPTNQPTEPPTDEPTISPTSSKLTSSPSNHPTNQPTEPPTDEPTTSPTSSKPTSSPTNYPSNQPSLQPTSNPSQSPTSSPTSSSTISVPTISDHAESPTIKLNIPKETDEDIEDESSDDDDEGLEDNEFNKSSTESLTESDAFIYVIIGIIIGLCVPIVGMVIIRYYVNKKKQRFKNNVAQMAKMENDSSPNIVIQNKSPKMMMTNTISMSSIPAINVVTSTNSDFEANLSSLAGANNILMDDVIDDMKQNEGKSYNVEDAITARNRATSGGPHMDEIDLNEDEEDQDENENDDNYNHDDDDDVIDELTVTMGQMQIITDRVP